MYKGEQSGSDLLRAVQAKLCKTSNTTLGYHGYNTTDVDNDWIMMNISYSMNLLQA